MNTRIATTVGVVCAGAVAAGVFAYHSSAATAAAGRAKAIACAPVNTKVKQLHAAADADAAAKIKLVIATHVNNSVPVILVSIRMAQEVLASDEYVVAHADCFPDEWVKQTRRDLSYRKIAVGYEESRLQAATARA